MQLSRYVKEEQHKKCFGSSGVCIQENDELLMVLQGKFEEDKTWSVSSEVLKTFGIQ